jgi:hypothetical protein
MNDEQRARLSRGRMIRSPVSNLDRRHIGRLRKRDNLLTGEGGGGGRGAYHMTQESLVLNHSILSDFIRKLTCIIRHS